MRSETLEVRRLGPEWEKPLAEFFQMLQATNTTQYFHPHPFTPEEATKKAHYLGQDLYYVLVLETKIIGYGMLRGWEEGYQIPSLGIALHPSMKGLGLGKAFMHFLHAAARVKGASSIRLKVYPDNTAAVKLYSNLGYRFVSQEAGQMIGVIDL